MLRFYREPSSDPYVSIAMDVNIEPALAFLDAYAREHSERVGVQHLATAATARCLCEMPALNVKIVGRVKEVLVPASGHNVAPAPLEQKLMAANDRLEQAVVFGHGRPYLTALVTGALQGDELDRILESVNADLPHYMRLRKLHRAEEPFTPENGLLTANQKLKRKAIEERYRDAIEAMYR